jgi:transposase
MTTLAELRRDFGTALQAEHKSVNTQRLYLGEHTAWVQRIHAILLHQGAPAIAGELLGAGQPASARGRRPAVSPPAGRPLPPRCGSWTRWTPNWLHYAAIAAFARRQPGCRALQAHYGVGEITAAGLWAKLGDTRRFSSSPKAVRHTGLDITVYSSDGKRPPGKLSRQGSPLLRRALFEAAKCAARPGAPDHVSRKIFLRRIMARPAERR